MFQQHLSKVSNLNCVIKARILKPNPPLCVGMINSLGVKAVLCREVRLHCAHPSVCLSSLSHAELPAEEGKTVMFTATLRQLF